MFSLKNKTKRFGDRRGEDVYIKAELNEVGSVRHGQSTVQTLGFYSAACK